jgi:hypothetical protein
LATSLITPDWLQIGLMGVNPIRYADHMGVNRAAACDHATPRAFAACVIGESSIGSRQIPVNVATS